MTYHGTLDIQHVLKNMVHPALLLKLQETNFHHRDEFFLKFMAPSDTHNSHNHCDIVVLSLQQLCNSLHVLFYIFFRKIISHVEKTIDVSMKDRENLAQCQCTVVVQMLYSSPNHTACSSWHNKSSDDSTACHKCYWGCWKSPCCISCRKSGRAMVTQQQSDVQSVS